MSEMSELLEDVDNLKLMEELVSGNAVSVNISELSRILGKHRNTIKNKVEDIFEHRILDNPFYPFRGLYRVYPLLAVVKLDIPDSKDCTENIIQWVKEDPQIFAAFRSRQGEYDTLLFTYHESITNYQLWISSIPSILNINYGVDEEDSFFYSSTAYFSNQLMIKYSPSTGINLIERDFKRNGGIKLRGYELDQLDLDIMRCLVNGKGIKTNHTMLCQLPPHLRPRPVQETRRAHHQRAHHRPQHPYSHTDHPRQVQHAAVRQPHEPRRPPPVGGEIQGAVPG
jgi:hypothetical protein